MVVRRKVARIRELVECEWGEGCLKGRVHWVYVWLTQERWTYGRPPLSCRECVCEKFTEKACEAICVSMRYERTLISRLKKVCVHSAVQSTTGYSAIGARAMSVIFGTAHFALPRSTEHLILPFHPLREVDKFTALQIDVRQY